MTLTDAIELADLDLSGTPTIEVTAVMSSVPAVVEPAPVRTVPDEREMFYGSMSATDAERLRSAAGRMSTCMGAVARGILIMGRELIAICDSLPGHFEEWLRLEFDMSRATAYNYMSVVRHFGDVPEVVKALPSTTVYKLAAKSTPDALREAVVKEIAGGAQVSPKDVDRRITEAKNKAREDKRAELERREREQKHLNAEAKWQAKEAALRDAGADDSQVAKERKKWDSTAAVKERARQQESDDEQRRRDEAVIELERNKKLAGEVVDLLGRSMPPDSFASLKAKARSLTLWSELRIILAAS
jgi:hypothetical protein